jgi:hypothetical protein
VRKVEENLEDSEMQNTLHPKFLFIWTLIGTSMGILDEMHTHWGVIVHGNNWVAKYFPSFLSPNYALGGLGIYLLYMLTVGIDNRNFRMQSAILGGKELSLSSFLWNYFKFFIMYFMTAIFCQEGNQHGLFPTLCGLLLALFGWMEIKKTRNPGKLIIFLLAEMILGCGFEWFMCTHEHGFRHGNCPSFSCFGTPIPVVWLPFLYMHAGLFIHNTLS